MAEIELVPAAEALTEAVADYYRRNRAFLEAFEPKRDEDFFTSEHQRALLREQERARAARTAFHFYIRRSGRVIGAIALTNVVWGPFQSAFLGYKLDRDCLNRGYMTQAVGLLAAHAFGDLRLHRIEANVMPRNTASLRVLEKNGFQNEGISKFYLNINGVWEDHIHMVLLNEAMHKEKSK